MENLTNQVIVLTDNTRYFILRQALYKGKTYFLAAGVTEDGENFTNEFVFLERKDEEDDGSGQPGFRVEQVTDEHVLSVLAKNIKLD